MAAKPRSILPSRVFITLAFVVLAAGALVTSGCFGDPKDFHPGQGPGGSYGGPGGHAAVGGNPGGYAGAGQGGFTGGGQGGATSSCSSAATTTFAVQWTLEDKTHQPENCEAAGAATMDLDLFNIATSAVTHDTFPCNAFAGTSAVVAPGNYSVAMRLRDAAGALLSEAVAPDAFTLGAGCSTDLGLVPFEVVVKTPDQFITLSWAIDRVGTGAALTCAAAHATTVELDAGTSVFHWPCSNGKGATGSLPPGNPNVAIKLIDGTGTVLSLTPTMPVTIVAGQPTALGGTVLFDVN